MGRSDTEKKITEPAGRLEKLPPYLFAELERKIDEKKGAGIDVISLGIGDPDMPTPEAIVEVMQAEVADPSTHQYPSNRGLVEFRQAFADFYHKRFNVELDITDEILPSLGSKEAIYNLCFAFLDPGDVALASDPGYPVYTRGPLLAGAESVLLPLRPDNNFVPDLDSIPKENLKKARLMFINYPNNPTGAVVPDGFFSEVVDLAEANEILVVHDNAYSETTFDDYIAPSFLETPHAKDVGIEVFSLSKGYNMTGWRCAAVVGNSEALNQYWRLKSNIDSGMFGAIQKAGAAALLGSQDSVKEMCAIYQRRRDLVIDALRQIDIAVDPPKGAIYVWAPVPDGYTSSSFAEHVLEEAAVVVSPGSAFGQSGEGFFRISLTVPDDRLEEAVDRIESAL